MNLTEVGCKDMEWRSVAQDRGNWQVVVNTVIDLWVPSNVVSFLTELLGSIKCGEFLDWTVGFHQRWRVSWLNCWVPSNVVSFLTELLGSIKCGEFLDWTVGFPRSTVFCEVYLFIYLFILSFHLSQLVSLAVGKWWNGNCFSKGMQWCSWCRHCTITLKVAGSIPDGVIGTFHWHYPSSCTMALGLTQPLTELSTSNISWG